MGQACCSKSEDAPKPNLASRRTVIDGEKDRVFQEEKGYKNAEQVKGQEEEYVVTDEDKFYSPEYFNVTNKEDEVEKKELEDGTTVIQNKFSAGKEFNEKDLEDFDSDPVLFSYDEGMSKKYEEQENEKTENQVRIMKVGNCNVSQKCN